MQVAVAVLLAAGLLVAPCARALEGAPEPTGEAQGEVADSSAGCAGAFAGALGGAGIGAVSGAVVGTGGMLGLLAWNGFLDPAGGCAQIFQIGVVVGFTVVALVVGVVLGAALGAGIGAVVGWFWPTPPARELEEPPRAAGPPSGGRRAMAY